MIKRIVISPTNKKAIEFFDKLSSRKNKMRSDMKVILAEKKATEKGGK